MRKTYDLKINRPVDEQKLNRDIFIVILHATRIPPHIGLIINGGFHSLSVKGHDINVPVEALLKNIRLRTLPTIFIRLKKHPYFSTEYLKEHFITNIMQYPKVDIDVATCLSPIKAFFNEIYKIDTTDVSYIFQLLPKLDAENFIKDISALHIKEPVFKLPYYSMIEINKGIESVRNEFKNS